MSEIGIVDGVSVDEDNNRVLVNVFLGPGRVKENVPFRSPAKGIWIVPEIDDLVEVYESAAGREAARTPHNVPGYSMPSGLQAGDIAITASEGTHITFTQNSDGTYDIDIAADGNITIDGIDFDEHTHDYSWTDSGGSGTTDPPE